jgi:hypothetical protein
MTIKALYPDTQPSLLLDFSNVKALDPRITFARASTARFYDGKTVAKAEENLFLRSEEFDNAAWAKSNVTVSANTEVAPNGTSTADLILETATTGVHTVFVQTSITTQAEPLTWSVYAKAGFGRDWLRIDAFVGTSNFTYFDIVNGVVGTNASGNTATIVDVGGGWYRCSISRTSGGANTSAGFAIASADGTVSYTGDITKGLILWGAQLEQRSSVTAYTPTTTQPITNYVPVLLSAANNVARFDHNPVTGESLGLLIEEQRTNLLTYSAEFDNAAWGFLAASVTANTIISPEGTLTADSLVESTAASSHYLQGPFASVTNGTSYTASIFAKRNGRSLQIVFNSVGFGLNAWVNFDLVNGAVGTVGSATTASIQDVGNGWYRCRATAPATATTSSSFIVAAITSSTSARAESYTGDGYSGIYIWGAQLEAGAFPTSYIPTTTAQVTRSADAASMTGANFSSWYRADEGTLYAEANKLFAASGFVYDISNGTLANEIRQTWGATNIRFCEITTNGASQSSLSFSSAYVNGEFVKAAHSYKFNDVAASVNAATVATDTSATIPVVNQIQIGARVGNSTSINSYIKKLAFYPKRLADAELQALTQN